MRSVLGPDEEVLQQIKNYHMFGDVFKQSFSEWWQQKRERILDANSAQPMQSGSNRHDVIRHYTDIVEDDIDYCIGRFAEEHGREPNASEMKLYLRQRLKQQESRRLTIAIEHRFASINVIQKILCKQLRDTFDKTDIKAYRARYGLLFMPISYRLPDEELEDYLSIYDAVYRDGLSVTEAILKMGSGKEKRALRAGKPERDAILEKYHRRLSKAKRIIRNVEDGEFPGDY
jgi:hypothetical protein